MYGIMFNIKSGFAAYTEFISPKKLPPTLKNFSTYFTNISMYLDEFERDLQKDILHCKGWFNGTVAPVRPPRVTSTAPTPPPQPVQTVSKETQIKLNELIDFKLVDGNKHYRIRNTKSIFTYKDKLEALINYITTIKEYFKIYETLPDDLKTQILAKRGNMQIAEKQLIDSYNALLTLITDAKLAVLYKQYDETLNKKGGNNKDYYKLYIKYKTKYIQLKSSIV